MAGRRTGWFDHLDRPLLRPASVRGRGSDRPADRTADMSHTVMPPSVSARENAEAKGQEVHRRGTSTHPDGEGRPLPSPSAEATAPSTTPATSATDGDATAQHAHAAHTWSRSGNWSSMLHVQAMAHDLAMPHLRRTAHIMGGKRTPRRRTSRWRTTRPRARRRRRRSMTPDQGGRPRDHGVPTTAVTRLVQRTRMEPETHGGVAK